MYFCKSWHLLRSSKPTLGFDQRLGAKVSWYAFHSEDAPVPKKLAELVSIGRSAVRSQISRLLSYQVSKAAMAYPEFGPNWTQ